MRFRRTTTTCPDEWARADFDRRHRVVMLGGISRHQDRRSRRGADAQLRRTVTRQTLGGDVYNNGRGRARPAGVVARNTREGDGFATLDLRASRDVKFGTGKDEPR